MSERVSITIDDHVAHVRLTRPEKRNGLDEAMFMALVEAGERIKADPTIRAVVMSGEGQAFCAGLDFMSFMASGQAGAERLLARDLDVSPANLAQRAPYIWQEVQVPVIAAVHGVAYGGGCQIALAADIRYIRADARMCVMEIRYGLIPDMAITQTLLRLVPIDVAKELTFTGRIITGEEAVRLGLATHLSEDPLADALALAAEFATKSPHALRAAKQLFNRAPELDAQGALALETELQLPLLGSRNQLEAVQASFQKRTPNFEDPEA